MERCYSVSPKISLQLSNLSWSPHLLHAAEESKGVCKLDPVVLKCEDFRLTLPSDLVCPLLKKIFGDVLKCASPEVSISCLFQVNLAGLTRI